MVFLRHLLLKSGYGKLSALMILLLCSSSAQGFFWDKTEVKNVILMIGDGMGPQQYSLAMSYAKYAPGSKKRVLNLEKLMADGELGMMLTNPHGAIVTDSAASATQLSTGVMAGSEMIGVDFKGNPQKTILEMARDAGKSTGLVSDTRITHATPAAFAAHRAHRSMENEIAEDLLASKTDVMLSAGLRNFIPQGVKDQKSKTYLDIRAQVPAHIKLKTKRMDDRNLLEEAKADGYDVVFDRQAMMKAPRDKRLLGLFEMKEMPNGIVEHYSEGNKERPHPTLKEMVHIALDRLSKDEDGFFLMIESGQIDWAGHANDVGTMLHQMLQFDETIGYVREWADKNGDTLVVLTADHETGSFGFSYSTFEKPAATDLPGSAFEGIQFKPKFNFAAPATLDRIYKQKKSFIQISNDFMALPKKNQTARQMQSMIKESTDYELTYAEAKAVIAPKKGDYFVHDFKEFYIYDGQMIQNRLGRALSRHQGVVWGTGSHTATPVPVIAYGPSAITEQFDGLHHSTEIGQLLQKAMGVK
jgi:alkaline phosphatase